MMVPEELGISKARIEQFIESYIGRSLHKMSSRTNTVSRPP